MHPRFQRANGVGVVTGDFEVVDAGALIFKAFNRDDFQLTILTGLNFIAQFEQASRRSLST